MHFLKEIIKSVLQLVSKLTLPTTVEPVNDIFLTVGFSHNIFPTSPALFLEHVTTFNTPGGRPAFSANCNIDKIPVISLYYFSQKLYDMIKIECL
jgi:hypothetical protein